MQVILITTQAEFDALPDLSSSKETTIIINAINQVIDITAKKHEAKIIARGDSSIVVAWHENDVEETADSTVLCWE
jgi:hypothetical protein